MIDFIEFAENIEKIQNSYLTNGICSFCDEKFGNFTEVNWKWKPETPKTIEVKAKCTFCKKISKKGFEFK